MDRDEITVGALIALKSGAIGVVTDIASDDDPSIPVGAPVRIRLETGTIIQIAYEEIADARPHGS